MREIASPTLRSGSEPTSSATIESMAVAAFFLRSMLDCCDARVPTTSTCFIASSAPAAGGAGFSSGRMNTAPLAVTLPYRPVPASRRRNASEAGKRPCTRFVEMPVRMSSAARTFMPACFANPLIVLVAGPAGRSNSRPAS